MAERMAGERDHQDIRFAVAESGPGGGTNKASLALLKNGLDVKPEYYFNGGLTYKITPMAQFDVRAGLGLNKAAADFFCGAGFSVKY